MVLVAVVVVIVVIVVPVVVVIAVAVGVVIVYVVVVVVVVVVHTFLLSFILSQNKKIIVKSIRRIDHKEIISYGIHLPKKKILTFYSINHGHKTKLRSTEIRLYLRLQGTVA